MVKTKRIFVLLIFLISSSVSTIQLLSFSRSVRYMNPHVPIGAEPGAKRDECVSGSDDPDEPDEQDYPSYDVMDVIQINDSVILPLNHVTRGHSNISLYDDPSVCKDNNINRNVFVNFIAVLVPLTAIWSFFVRERAKLSDPEIVKIKYKTL